MTLRSVLPILGVSGLVLVTGMALLFAIANRRWRSDLREMDVALEDSAGPATEVEWLAPEVLPTPVGRFSRRVRDARDGGPIRSARLWQSGEFQMGEGESGWRRFEAIEAFRASPPAFYWNATIRMIPFVPVRVRDAFVQGEGSMLAKVGGVVTVMKSEGSEELAEGALSRYLAEAPWFPTRLLTGPGLVWSPVNENEAEATLEAEGVRVTLRFTFDDEGAVVQVDGLRAREADGGFEQTPWVGRFTDYRVMDGEWIPTWGEVAWVVDGAEVPYWRGTIERAEYRRQEG